MFKNKHMTLALLIAPVLAIIAWFSVDYFVAERPHIAKPGASYAMVAKPNCRRFTERCDLANEDVEMSIVVTSQNARGIDVELTTNVAADRVAVGVAGGTPTALTFVDSDRQRWAGRIPAAINADSLLRVAAIASDATFYAEVPVTFFYPERGIK